jgi:uncharacterized protein (DUF4415 family)
VAKKETIVSYTVEELTAMPSMTDWARVDAMPRNEGECMAIEEEGDYPKGWQDTIIIGIPEPKQDVHIRLDSDVLRWFKAQGPGYQTRINAVLRGFVQAKLGDRKLGSG